MEPYPHKLKNDSTLLIREVARDGARAVLHYLQSISGESDFLYFGPGEFEFTELQEEEFIRKYIGSDHQRFILGSIDDTMVALLNFTAGHRPRIRHAGEFSMSVRKPYWAMGIGSWMLDTLIGWAGDTHIVKIINLLVPTDNQGAILLYERNGFVIEGTMHKAILSNGKYHDLHWMELEL